MSTNGNGLPVLPPPLTTPPSPGLDINADQGPRIVAVSVVLMLIAFVVVLLRLVARYLSRAGFWWDDWTVVAAMVVSWGISITMIYSTYQGFGKHEVAEGSLQDMIDDTVVWFKLLYAYETLYTVAITLTKISILLFYSRIFKEPRFKLALYIVTGLVLFWFLACEITVLAECRPVSRLWNFTEPGTCIDLRLFFIGVGVPNVLFNTIILLLPLPMIWSLEIERRHKLALSGAFMLGSFVVAISIVRLVILSKLQLIDITWTFVDLAIWTSIEPTIAVVSACLPILRSLWVRSRATGSSRGSIDSSRNNGVPTRSTSWKVRASLALGKAGRLGYGNGNSNGSKMPLAELPVPGPSHLGHTHELPSTRRPQLGLRESEDSDIAMNKLPIQLIETEEVVGRKDHHGRGSSASRHTAVAELYA